MILHLFKLIWKQRRQNAWIAAELFLVFLLVWYCMDYFITLGYTSSVRNAYDIKNTYQVRLATVPPTSQEYIRYDDPQQQAVEDFRSLIERLRQYAPVETVCLSNASAPYSPNYRNQTMGKDTASIHYCQLLEVEPAYFEVFRIAPFNGGSPSLLKKVLTEKNLILSRKAKETLFPGGTAPTDTFYIYTDHPEPYRVGEVCGALKPDDYSREEAAVYTMLSPSVLSRMDEQTVAGLEISLRVKPGADGPRFPADFRRDMQETLRAGNFLFYDIRSYEHLRDNLYLVNGVTNAVRYRIAFMLFLVFNIFLGIISTFWFRNEYRKPEIGLRMAVGSTRRQIFLTMIGEGWLILTSAALPAVLICLNLVKAEIPDTRLMDITCFRIVAGLLSTYVFIAGVILLGTWYPAYLSSRIAPADTLRNE